MIEAKVPCQVGSECPQCAELRGRLERIQEIVMGNGDARRGRRTAEYATAYGKVIAAAAEAHDMKLPQVSAMIGFAPDYIARVCRGSLPLSRRAALLIGGALGVDLLSYLKVPVPPPRLPQSGPVVLNQAVGSTPIPVPAGAQPALPGAEAGR